MVENKRFEKIDFRKTTWCNDEYDGCLFVACDFSDQVIHNTGFDNCVFQQCNFSMVTWACRLRETRFVECKMTGADWSSLGRFSASLTFVHCCMDYAT